MKAVYGNTLRLRLGWGGRGSVLVATPDSVQVHGELQFSLARTLVASTMRNLYADDVCSSPCLGLGSGLGLGLELGLGHSLRLGYSLVSHVAMGAYKDGPS